MKKSRKRKYVVWLHNNADRRDDEWLSVWADSPNTARELIDEKLKVDWTLKNRFTLGAVMTALEFRKNYGFGA